MHNKDLDSVRVVESKKKNCKSLPQGFEMTILRSDS